MGFHIDSFKMIKLNPIYFYVLIYILSKPLHLIFQFRSEQNECHRNMKPNVFFL